MTEPGLNRSFLCPLIAILLLAAASGAQGREISSWAVVNEDASLRIDGKTIHLYGIHIPDSGRTCAPNRRPIVCGTRASLALDFKIQGFVRCDLRERREDRSFVGRCRVNASSFSEGDDLSSYLLRRGWAVALPNAPIEYQTLEKIARNRGLGVWGFPVDNAPLLR